MTMPTSTRKEAILFNADNDLFVASDEDNSMASSSSSKEDLADEDTPPTTVVVMMIRNKQTQQDELFRVLLDSGTNRCMGTQAAVQRAGLHIKPSRQHKYNTAAGTFTTTHSTRIRSHKLLELNSRRTLQNTKVQITSRGLGIYDFIFGRDYMNRYGIDLLFSEQVIRWDGMRMPMKQPDEVSKLSKLSLDNDDLTAATEPETDIDDSDQEWIDERWDETFAQHIKDSKYEKQDLLRVARDQKHLTPDQQNQLHSLLERYNDLFQGNLGEWPDETVSIELKPDATPYHCGKPIRIPHIHLETLKKEVDRLVEIGVLEIVDGATAGPWCSPSFITAKKDGRVRFVTDYREVNKRIHRRPWPMPHINDLMQDIGQYKYVTALDLSMGYYHFRLDDAASDLSTFVLPFGMYKYRRLAMGLTISPDIFQERISKLFSDLPFIKSFLDDLLIFSNGSYEDHLQKVQKVLERLHSKNLAVNALKSYWAVKEVDYLGFRLTPNGVMPQARKVKAILDVKPPRTRKQVRHFIGLVNYYRHMWRKRSHILAPLTALASNSVPFKWTDEHQAAFEEVKRTISKEVMLNFPDYSKGFQLKTDASNRQIGAVLKQGDKTLAFFSKKLTPTQLNYGVGEKEMLSVVEALKEFRTMIFGYPIDVYVDHKNWTHDKTIRNSRVMRWRLLLEDFAPTFHYIQGEKNDEADALSRLPFFDTTTPDDDDDIMLAEQIMDLFEWRKFYQPITLKEIGEKQQTDQYVQTVAERAPDRLGLLFEDIGKKTGPDQVLTEKDPTDRTARIIVPQNLTKRLIQWYHTMLVHPGVNRLYYTLRQHYTWPRMKAQIELFIKHCDACQKGKRGLRGMGKVPIKDVETEPWKDVAVDLSGPWKAVIDNKDVEFHTLTVIDVFTSWVEIIPITTKKKESIKDLFVQEWMRRYPRPSRCIFDQGGEFDNDEFIGMLNLWYVKHEPITVKNPRANAIVERMHRVLGDMLRVQLVTTHEHDDPLKDLTSAAAYAIRATVHGTTGYTPGQLVFSKDMILRTQVEANVELVRQRREQAILKSNARENKRRIAYKYKPGDQVLILSGRLDPKLKLHQGPYKVLNYDQSTGTLHISRKNYIEPINIRNVRPYFGTSRGGD